MAAGGQQLLRITPEKVIEFPAVPYRSAAAELLLRNVSSTFVAFKIKTTAPKSYLVRPSTGIIPSGETEKVHIVFQAVSEEHARACTDRFLIQSTAVQSDTPLARDYWQTLDKDKIEDTRLSVVFHSVAQGSFGSATGGSAASMGEHLHPTAGLPGSFGGTGGAPGAGGVYTGTGGAAPTAGTVTAGGGSSYSEDLKNRYDQLVEYALALERHKEDLVKEIESLKQQLNRKNAASHKTGGMGFFELWHFPVYVFIGVIIWYLLGRSSDSSTKSALSHR
eukprot:XP_028344276.1 vesicle-associated protein 1-2-like [Physeter catodon]